MHKCPKLILNELKVPKNAAKTSRSSMMHEERMESPLVDDERPCQPEQVSIELTYFPVFRLPLTQCTYATPTTELTRGAISVDHSDLSVLNSAQDLV